MIIKLLLAVALSVMVLAAACGGGEAPTTNAPNEPAFVEKSTVAPTPTSVKTPTVQSTLVPSANPVDEADSAEALVRFQAGNALGREGHLNQSQGGNYILERWQRHGRCKHQCVGSGL